MELLILLLALFIYFLPTMIGWNKKSVAGITILNLFLGWSILGWIAALIWAVESPAVNN